VTVESLTSAFDRADYTAVQTGFRQAKDLGKLIREYRAARSPWPNAPHQDAVFALELGLAGLHSDDLNTRDEANRLLMQYDTLVRHPLGADNFECTWYWAEVAGLEGLIRPVPAKPFVARALLRCPNEARLHLAQAFVTDQQWPLGTTSVVAGQQFVVGPGPELDREISRLYDQAMKFAETAAEARVRGAWFSYRTGRFDRANELIGGIQGQPADRHVSYLADLVRGHALRAQGHDDAAAASFRAALTTWPGAQSARIALMTLLVNGGRRPEAEALAEAIQTEPASQFDPWWTYWQGDYRAYPSIIGRLRGLAR
jgi:hypothetical protein